MVSEAGPKVLGLLRGRLGSFDGCMGGKGCCIAKLGAMEMSGIDDRA